MSWTSVYGALLTIAGPLIGGALTQYTTWRWCFYLNLPVGVVATVCLSSFRLPGQPEQFMDKNFRSVARKFDLLGFSLLAGASVMLLLSFQWGGSEYAWSSSEMIGLLAGSASTFVLFIIWESHAGINALIPGAILQQRAIYSAVLTSGFQGAGMILATYYLPLYFQVAQHASPFESAVRVLPTLITQVIGAATSGIWSRLIIDTMV